MTKHMEAFRVWVEGWSLPRRVGVDNGKVVLEVVKESCHCDTCFSRLRSVSQTLAQKGIEPHTVPFGGGGVAIVVPMNEGEDPCRVLSDNIGRTVRHF